MGQNIIIQVDSKIDEKVYRDFSDFNSFVIGKRKVTMALAVIVLLIFAGVNWMTGGKVLGIICAALAVLSPVSYLYIYETSLRGQIRKFHLEEARYFYTVKLSGSGIAVENETQKTSFTWQQTYRVYELDQYFYVYITKARGYILPKNDIVCGTEDILRGIITENLPKVRYIDKRRS